MSKRMVSLFLSAVMFVVCSFGATATYAAENIETAIIDGKEYSANLGLWMIKNICTLLTSRMK